MAMRFKTKQIEAQECVGATCDQCGVELEPVYMGIGENVFHGALHVTIGGAGYGEFMDGGPSIQMILCVKCAQALVDAYPFLKSHADR